MNINDIERFSSLLKRIIFSIFALTLYRFGTYLTIPGVNNNVLQQFVDTYSTGFLGVFNMFSGGALGRMTIFALNVMPYIISSIILQLLSVNIPALNNLRNEGESGRKKINFYTRLLTVVFSVVQGSFIVLSIQSMGFPNNIILSDMEIPFFVIAIFTLMGGTLFLVWLGEQITIYGIGNGVSLIIVTGILAELPGAFSSFLALGKVGSVSSMFVLMVMLFFIFLLWFIIYIEQSYRKIHIHHPRKQIGHKLYNANSSYIPIKINMSGVIAPIFANALLMFPLTVANFFPDSIISSFIILNFSPGKILYVIFYCCCIMFFCFFYVGIIFDVNETADNLKKNGGFILGKRPGKDTSLYLQSVLMRVTILGGLYLSLICIVPELMRSQYSIPFVIGGTSLLIIVNVIIDIFSQIRSYLFTHNYNRFNLNFDKVYR